MKNSIQGRLNLAFIGLTLTVFAILWVLQGMAVREVAYEFVSARMQGDARTVLQAVMSKDDKWQIDPEYISPVYTQPMSGHYYQFLVDDGEWSFSRSLWDEEIPTYDGKPVGQLNIDLQYKRDKPWLVYDNRFEKAGHTIRIVLAEDISQIEAKLKSLSWWVAGIGLLFILILLIVQILVIRNGLKSLTCVQQDIIRLKEGDISTLSEVQVKEIAPLVNEINYMIESMTLRLDRSRHAVGNLAHAAKTPLTVIDRQIETLRQSSPDCANALEQQSQALRNLVERELTRARIAGAAMPGQKVIIEEEVEKLTKAMKMIYRDKALEYEISIKSTTFFPGERDDLIELMGNLIDNASKWATTKVRIRGMMNEHCLELCIEDDGPGIPEDKMTLLMSRGERLDESTVGHGLGLSIVMEIVRQYKGVFQLLPSNMGGLHTHLLLPRQQNAELKSVMLTSQ
ncbi:sensor histidine kinase [Neptunomonas japonica]|uniref:sensor histidine kinase n=1 Tax=Neptunomonas japonica TaxID=417574 RepID=UPI00048AE5B9|nr:sensor histidine kinase [Neptunomonas japonica]